MVSTALLNLLLFAGGTCERRCLVIRLQLHTGPFSTVSIAQCRRCYSCAAISHSFQLGCRVNVCELATRQAVRCALLQKQSFWDSVTATNSLPGQQKALYQVPKITGVPVVCAGDMYWHLLGPLAAGTAGLALLSLTLAHHPPLAFFALTLSATSQVPLPPWSHQ